MCVPFHCDLPLLRCPWRGPARPRRGNGVSRFFVQTVLLVATLTPCRPARPHARTPARPHGHARWQANGHAHGHMRARDRLARAQSFFPLSLSLSLLLSSSLSLFLLLSCSLSLLLLSFSLSLLLSFSPSLLLSFSPYLFSTHAFPNLSGSSKLFSLAREPKERV